MNGSFDINIHITIFCGIYHPFAYTDIDTFIYYRSPYFFRTNDRKAHLGGVFENQRNKNDDFLIKGGKNSKNISKPKRRKTKGEKTVSEGGK